MPDTPSALNPNQRCQIIPLANRQFQFCIDGVEKTRWHFADDAPRPFFFPINGPSRICLTRMGHPGAPDHDHHRSFWFAHHAVLGIDFWSEETTARIEQTQWYAIVENDERATVAFELAWKDGHDPAPLLKQKVFTTIRPVDATTATSPGSAAAWTLELQSDFTAEAEGVAFRESNFGILGLRVSKDLSVVFGRGTITGADGRRGENALFGEPNRWIDYSGPVGSTTDLGAVLEGLTLIDHARNPGHATDLEFTRWHVRDDGWIGPSISRSSDIELIPGKILRARYMLLIHGGPCQTDLANAIADQFNESPALEIRSGTRPHHQYDIVHTA